MMKRSLLTGSLVLVCALVASPSAHAQATQAPPVSYRAPVPKQAPITQAPAITNGPTTPTQTTPAPAETFAPQPPAQTIPAVAETPAPPTPIQSIPTPAVTSATPPPTQATPAPAETFTPQPPAQTTQVPVATAAPQPPTQTTPVAVETPAPPTPIQSIPAPTVTSAPPTPPQVSQAPAVEYAPPTPPQTAQAPPVTTAPTAPVQAAQTPALADAPQPPAQAPVQITQVPVATAAPQPPAQTTPAPAVTPAPATPAQTIQTPATASATPAPTQTTPALAVTYVPPTTVQSTLSPAVEYTPPTPAQTAQVPPATSVPPTTPQTTPAPAVASAPPAPVQTSPAPANTFAAPTPAQTTPVTRLTYAPPTPAPTQGTQTTGINYPEPTPAKITQVPVIDYSAPSPAQTTQAVGISYPPPLRRANSHEPADLIIHNARVLTVDSNFSIAEAVAVRSNLIMAVGSDREIMQFQGTRTRMIDAGGKTVMPGLYDAQVDSWRAAVSELSGPLPVLDSIAAAQEYIRKRATNTPAGGWIVLDQLYSTRLKENRLPTKAELDAATTNVPVCWNFGPVSVVNSKALQFSGITKETTDPKGGEIVKDRKNLKPTGLLRKKAVALLRLPLASPAPTPQKQRAALKRLYGLYNQRGITSIGEQAAEPAAIELFRSLSRSNELTLRINCTRVVDPGTNNIDDALALLDAITNAPAGRLPYGPTGTGDDWVRIGALKTFLDGDVAVATAYLRTPYGIGPTYQITEPAYRAQLRQDLHVLPEFMLEAARRGWQITLHCAGDAALDFAMNSFERVQFDIDIRDRRFSVTHNAFQAASDWDRCIKLGIAADLQPNCLYLDGASLLTTLGEPRLGSFLPMKSWLDRGLLVGVSSGHTAGLDSLNAKNPWNPWFGMWVAVTRETSSGFALNPQEALTREQAVRLYTINNARLNFEEKKKGSLEAGKLADLIVLDTDITKCPVDDLRGTGVLFTMVNGKIVWESRNSWPDVSLTTVRQPEPQPHPQPPQPQ